MMSVVTTGLSVSAGMFIPALLSGAAWGRLVGIGMENCFPDSVRDREKCCNYYHKLCLNFDGFTKFLDELWMSCHQLVIHFNSEEKLHSV